MEVQSTKVKLEATWEVKILNKTKKSTWVAIYISIVIIYVYIKIIRKNILHSIELTNQII